MIKLKDNFFKQYLELRNGNTFKYSEAARRFTIKYMSASIFEPTKERYKETLQKSAIKFQTTSDYFQSIAMFSIDIKHVSLIIILYSIGSFVAFCILAIELFEFRIKRRRINLLRKLNFHHEITER